MVKDSKVRARVQDVFAAMGRVLRQVGWSKGARPQQRPRQAQQKRHEQIHQDGRQGWLDCLRSVEMGGGWCEGWADDGGREARGGREGGRGIRALSYLVALPDARPV